MTVAVRAVVEVQGDRHGDVADQRLERCANSCSRPYMRTVLTEVCRITGDRSSTAAASTASMRQVVEDVEGGDAVPVGERAVEDLLHRHDRHETSPNVLRRVGPPAP